MNNVADTVVKMGNRVTEVPIRNIDDISRQSFTFVLIQCIYCGIQDVHVCIGTGISVSVVSFHVVEIM